jgi:hypothetical protein
MSKTYIPAPWPKLVRDLPGLRVRTRYIMQNGMTVVPPGTIGTITGGHQWDELHFKGDACPCCNVHILMRRCSKSAFEPIQEA